VHCSLPARSLPILWLLAACPKPALPVPEVAGCPVQDDVMALAWVQTSAEYDAIALGAFNAAGPALDRALADPTWTAATEQTGDFAALPPAIVVDVDETVLDNSPYQVRNLEDGAAFEPASWAAWVGEGKARVVPGAAAFLAAAKAKGVDVFYVSNRDADQVEPSRANLAALGFPDTEDADTFLFRPAEGPSRKSPRRAQVAATHRVVLMFGDNLFDFVEGDEPDLAARDALVTDRLAWWGTRWFMIPNPLYGSWDDALAGYERGLPADARHARRLESLQDAR
jgi:5'-nucleotidase (lipoprotein e(P4) family)